MSDVLVLCYHAVSEHWPADLSVTTERLEEQLSLLVERGYRGVTFHEAVAGRPEGKALAVTFDDAYRSVHELAFPILSRLGLPASVFAPTAFVGTGAPMAWRGIDQWLDGPHRQELVALSWPELKRLAEAGWEIGSHTRSHPRLTQLDDTSLARELEDSRRDCERRLGRTCHSLAYPFGDVDGRVVEAARAAGYSAAATLPARLHRPLPLRWPRVGVYRVDGRRRFRAKVSRTVRRLRASPAWEAIDTARAAAGRPTRRGETR